MGRSVELDELVEHWTLLDDEQGLVAGKRGGPRLAFALLSKFFVRHGRFPRGWAELPDERVEFVAWQVGVGAADLGFYDWSGRTARYHQAQIRGHLGFRECSVADADKLTARLAGEVCEAERHPERVRGVAGPLSGGADRAADADLVNDNGQPICSAHTVRHTFGTNLLRPATGEGADIVVAELMDHAPGSTSRADTPRPTHTDLEQAVTRLPTDQQMRPSGRTHSFAAGYSAPTGTPTADTPPLTYCNHRLGWPAAPGQPGTRRPGRG